MEQGRGDGDHQPLPLTRRLRVLDYQGPPPPPRKCPRCQSNDTKFCYFNNYSVVQPRYFCRACKRHWTYGGVQRDIPTGGRSHNARRSTRCENARVVALPSPPQHQPSPPPTDMAPLALVPLTVPPAMTSYRAGGGFLPPLVEEAIAQPQQFQAQNRCLRLVNPLKNMEPLYNSSGQTFLQPADRHSSGSGTQKLVLSNNGGASSSNATLLNTSISSAPTSGGIDGGWGSLLVNPNEWPDFPGFGPSA